MLKPILMTCPKCDKKLRVALPSDTVTSIRCPKCGTSFAPRVKKAAVEEVASKSEPKSRPSKKSKKRKEGPSLVPLAIGGGVGLILLIVVVSMILLLRGRSSTSEPKVAAAVEPNAHPNPAAPTPKPADPAKPADPVKTPAPSKRPEAKAGTPAPLPPPVVVRTPVKIEVEGLASGVVERVSSALVQVEVTLHGKVNSGAGFFAEKGDVVFAYMTRAGYDFASLQLASIELVVTPNAATVRRVPAKAIGMGLNGLILLKAEGYQCPEPLQFTSAEKAQVGDPVFLFNAGEERAKKAPNAGPWSVQSLRRLDAALFRVNIHGGNVIDTRIGGPAVDAEGRVLGVLISGPPQKGIIALAPGTAAQSAMTGSLSEFIVGEPKFVNELFQFPVTLKRIDPFERSKDIEIVYWLGPSVGSMPELDEPKDGTAKTLRVVFPEGKNEVSAMIETAAPKIGTHGLWIRPRRDEAQWKAAKFYRVPRSPSANINLAWQTNTRSRPMRVRADYDVKAGAESVARLLKSVDLGYGQTRKPTGELSVDSLASDSYAPFVINGKEMPPTPFQNDFAPLDWRGSILFNKAGIMTGTWFAELNLYKKYGFDVRVGEFNELVTMVVIPLPEADVVAGKSWTFIRPLPAVSEIGLPGTNLHLTCTYRSLVSKGDRECAVVQIEGEARATRGKAEAGATASGQALIFIDDGSVHSLRLDVRAPRAVWNAPTKNNWTHADMTFQVRPNDDFDMNEPLWKDAWVILNIQRQGKVAQQTRQWTFSDFTYLNQTQTSNPSTGKFWFRPDIAPNAIDVRDSGGSGIGGRGIFEIKGNLLRICFAEGANMRRPTAFVVEPGTSDTLVTFQRAPRIVAKFLGP